MKLVFLGLEKPIDLDPGYATVIEIANPALFARVTRSLQTGSGENAPEPYSLWDGDEERRFGDCCLLVTDLLDLPWDDRRLTAAVISRIEREFLEDEDLRREVERAQQTLATSLFSLGGGLDSSYEFGADWDFKRYLKMMGFGPAVHLHQSFLDNLLEFISFVLDSGGKQIIAFVNLKTFLTEKELAKLYEHVFYTGISLLLLENKPDDTCYDLERKRVVDQHFLEF